MQRYEVTLSTSADSARHMDMRSCQATARQDEILKRRQLRVHLVDPLLKSGSMLLLKSSMGKFLFVLVSVGSARCRYMRPHIDQSRLDLLELVTMRVPWLFVFASDHCAIVMSCESKVGIQLIDAAQ